MKTATTPKKRAATGKPAVSGAFELLPPNAATRALMDRILKVVRDHQRFLLTAHVRADGDGIGSELALFHWLKRLGKTPHVVNDGGIHSLYDFLPGASEAGNGPEDLRSDYEVVITVDSGNFERLERLVPALKKQKYTLINIDHHKSNTRFGDINWIDPVIGSVGEMIYGLIRHSGVPLERNMALPIYISILSDTGRFSFSCTRPESHLITADLMRTGIQPGEVTYKLFGRRAPAELRLQADLIQNMAFHGGGKVAVGTMDRSTYARCGGAPYESQDFVDLLLHVDGVEIALFIRHMDDEDKVKGSIRTRPPHDATKIADVFGGGGHARASGFSASRPLAEVTAACTRAALDLLARNSGKTAGAAGGACGG